MTKFIGRQQELQKLQDLFQKPSASLVVIKGRRRIGKSRLLEEFGQAFKNHYFFSGLPPIKEQQTDAQGQRDEFSRQLNRQLGKNTSPTDNWSDLFWHLSEQVKTGRTLIVLDEISWMGSKDPHFLGQLKNAWDLYFKKNDQLILAVCGSASHWIDRNILSNTGFLGRRSLTLTLEELPFSDCVEFWGSEKQKISPHEKFKILSVTGGIPRYLEHINPRESAEDNIRRLCFQPDGILFTEFEDIFSDLFYPRNPLYKNIVTHLANGSASQQSLLEKLQLKQSGDLPEYLDDLIKSGFVSRDFTWNIKNQTISKLSQYRLKDNYSRFYLKYVAPHRLKIESGDMQQTPLSTLPGWASVMGLQFENMVLSNRALIKKALQINPTEVICDNPFFQRKTSRQPGCQIDYLIQTRHNTLYVCEIKYSKKEIGLSITEDMNQKIARLKIPRHFSYRTVLIHVSDLSEELVDSQYFSHTVNISDFLNSKR